MLRKSEQKISWPENCVWPEPNRDGLGDYCEVDMVDPSLLDEEGEELLEIKEYFDRLVEEGRLNPDYTLNEEYEFEEAPVGVPEEESDNFDDFDEAGFWEPEIGKDYWDDGFDVEGWEEEFLNHVNLLKISILDYEHDPVQKIREVIDYEFINENLLRQAFTRRAFQVEHGLSGCNEELEFFGDTALNTVVTRELLQRFTELDIIETDAPFRSRFNEGDLSKIRARFVSKEYLARRAKLLGLDRWILYGTGEEETGSALEDMMEALIGAAAVDCGWDWNVMGDIVDKLLCLQLDRPDELVKQSYFEQLNAWHQKHFGSMPEYEVYRSIHNGVTLYDCTLRYMVPENDKGIWTSQRIDLSQNETRSSAREYAARQAVFFIQGNGLWMNLKDAGIVPDLENSINQLQELYQKKYITEKPEYSFEESLQGKGWYCRCIGDGFEGWGEAAGKVPAKKKAAYMVLVRLMMSAGMCEDEWEKKMWENA